MNWTCLVYGGPMFCAIVWFFVDAHKWFKGPKINIEHMMLGRTPEQHGLPVEDGPGVKGDSASSGSDVNNRAAADEKVATIA